MEASSWKRLTRLKSTGPVTHGTKKMSETECSWHGLLIVQQVEFGRRGLRVSRTITEANKGRQRDSAQECWGHGGVGGAYAAVEVARFAAILRGHTSRRSLRAESQRSSLKDMKTYSISFVGRRLAHAADADRLIRVGHEYVPVPEAQAGCEIVQHRKTNLRREDAHSCGRNTVP